MAPTDEGVRVGSGVEMTLEDVTTMTELKVVEGTKVDEAVVGRKTEVVATVAVLEKTKGAKVTEEVEAELVTEVDEEEELVLAAALKLKDSDPEELEDEAAYENELVESMTTEELVLAAATVDEVLGATVVGAAAVLVDTT